MKFSLFHILEYIQIPIITRRSMSDTTTSLDIQKGKGTVLDIARVFPMTSPRTLDLARHAEFVDGIVG